VGNQARETVKLFNLGGVTFDQGCWDQAIEYYRRSIDLATELEQWQELAFTTCYLAVIRLHRGRIVDVFGSVIPSLSYERGLRCSSRKGA
jgi:tetratricopeptide (TPR) repeat protein